MNKYRDHIKICLIGFSLIVIIWVLGNLSSTIAWYQHDLNAYGIGFGDKPDLNLRLRDIDNWFKQFTELGIFMVPFIFLVISVNSIKFKRLVLIGLGLFTILSIYILFDANWGDRKGCVGCEGQFYLYLLFICN